MPTIDIVSVALVGLALAFAAFVQGFSGFGFGILAMALISLFAPNAERVSVVVTLTGLAVQITLGVRGWRQSGIDLKIIALLLVGIVVGIPLGYDFLWRTGQNGHPMFRLIFGLVLVAFALNGLFRPHLKRNIHGAWAPPIGFISGWITGAFSSGGPPLVLYVYARKEDPRLAKGTLQVLFLCGSLIRLLSIELLAVHGGRAPITQDLLIWAGAFIPLAIIVTLAGHALAQRVSLLIFTKAIYFLIMAAGLMQISRSFS